MQRYIILIVLWVLGVSSAAAQQPVILGQPYDLGTLQVSELYVGLSGNDSNDGATPETALRTINEAWNRIPQGTELTQGYRIWIMAGTYTSEDLPNYWESRYGTAAHPIIFEALEGASSVTLPSVNIFDARYLYFLNLKFASENDVFHCEQCDHILLRGNILVGTDPETYSVQETVKINQSTYVFLEDNDISGAWDNTVDFVAVQYGHFLNNRIHNAGDWCAYVKGGSAYFVLTGNEFYDCGTGGFTAGQGTGFQFMTPPYFQYETYDIKFYGNLIHDVQGAGVGVQGGYNILIAYNVMYHLGERSHLMEFVFGSRSCDGNLDDPDHTRCIVYSGQGGWGNGRVADGENYARIPNKNVFVYNNLLINPAGYQSGYQHLFVSAPYTSEFQGTAPAPALADDNLQLRGNVIVNGASNFPLGIEASPDFPAGCQADNPTCNAAQFMADNTVNTLALTAANPAQGDFSTSAEAAGRFVAIPDFAAWDVPVAAGNLSNAIPNTLKTQGTSFTPAP